MLRFIDSKDRIFYGNDGKTFRLPSISSVDVNHEHLMVREGIRVPKASRIDVRVFQKTRTERQELKKVIQRHKRTLRKLNLNPKKVMNHDMKELQKMWNGHFSESKHVTGLRKNISNPPIVTFFNN